MKSRIAFILGAIFCVAVIFPTLVHRTGRTDLNILIDAATRLYDGKQVYDLRDPNEHTKPPLATLLFLPLISVNRFLMERSWDVLNIIALLLGTSLLSSYLVKKTALTASTLGLLGILSILNPLNTEIRMGQYNGILLLLIAGLVHWPNLWSGAGLAISILLKPSNLIFVPWFFRHQPYRRVAGMGFLVTVLSLSAIYVSMFGLDSIVLSHRDWLNFLPQSTAKHLYRDSNFSLLKYTTLWGWPSSVISIVGVSAMCLFAIWPRDWLESLCVLILCNLVLTPMAWLQNYVLLLPYCMLLWKRVLTSRDLWAIVNLSILYISTNLFNPTFTQMGLWGRWALAPVPLIGVSVVLVVEMYREFKLR